MIIRRELSKSEMCNFEDKASNPSRLLGNSTQLLKEEKFRKIVAVEYPKLTDDLRRQIAKWERQNSPQRIIFASYPYLDTMNDEKESPEFGLMHLKLLLKKPGFNNNVLPTISISCSDAEVDIDTDTRSCTSSLSNYSPTFKSPKSPTSKSSPSKIASLLLPKPKTTATPSKLKSAVPATPRGSPTLKTKDKSPHSTPIITAKINNTGSVSKSLSNNNKTATTPAKPPAKEIKTAKTSPLKK